MNLIYAIFAEVSVPGGADSVLGNDIAEKLSLAEKMLVYQAYDISYAFKCAGFTFILLGAVGLGIAIIMKLLYLYMKRERLHNIDTEKNK